ncbi:MAG: hypothetical protein AAF244_00040 [Pseudomonadota bacterium]
MSAKSRVEQLLRRDFRVYGPKPRGKMDMASSGYSKAKPINPNSPQGMRLRRAAIERQFKR